MSSEDIKILEFNQYQKFDKTQLITYADPESLMEKINVCRNNPEKPSTTKGSEHIPSGFSISAITSFKGIENKHNVYKGKDCMNKICESLREHTMKITNFKKKK